MHTLDKEKIYEARVHAVTCNLTNLEAEFPRKTTRKNDPPRKTTMADFLFYLCIAPLESAMRATLLAAHALTGSWGVSLVLLSLAVNTALIPVYHLAETWQEAERAVQRAMAPRLKEFKEIFTGREQYMYTRALYRLHGYSPIYALRTSFGLLIQVPFFFAAYHLLNAAPELAGVQWLFIHDLARPDGLFSLNGFSVNILPFAMTAANLASAAVYTSRLTKREKVQLYGLAALFLVLLYPSSAALLVYWTCNNLFSLAKNIVYTRYIYTNKEDAAHLQHGKKLPPAPSHLPAWLDPALLVSSVAVLVLGIIARKRVTVTPAVLAMMITCAVLSASALAARLRRLRAGDGIARWYGIFPLVIAGLVTICIWKLTSFKKIAEPEQWAFFRLQAVSIGFMAGWVFARQPLQPLLCRAANVAAARIDPKNATALFMASALAMAILVCWYTPAALYASDPDFFYEPLGALAGGLTFRGLVFLAASLLIYHWSRTAIRPFLALVWAWAALASLLFTFVATGDYGTMDDFILQDSAPLKTRLAFLVDIAVSASSAMALFLALRKRASRALTGLLQGVCFALCVMAAWQVMTAPESQNTSLEQAASRLPDYNDELFGFTRNGENTLVIMIDMFTGGHMKRILASTPELEHGLDGFTWYPDTMAPGATTLLSIGALLGGENYTPPAINARGTPSLREELHRAFATLPGIFAPRGYAVALADVDELVPSLFEKMCPAAPETLVVGKTLATAYTAYWREKHGLPSPLPESRAPFMGSVGLFQAAPWTVRDHIYYDGSWIGTQTVIHNPSEGPYAMLDILPEVANTDQPGNTLKYITSQVAHYPWRLDAKTCTPVERKGPNTVGPDRVIEEHVGNERCGLLALARWFAWMRREGVYDNTQIIIVSDHDGNDSPNFGKAFDDLRPGNTPWKPDALLLVKQRNARGARRTDNRPMSSADVVPLVCAANGPCPGVSYADPLVERGSPRIRTHSAGLASIRRHKKDAFTTIEYTVTGSMFDRKNWKKLEKKP